MFDIGNITNPNTTETNRNKNRAVLYSVHIHILYACILRSLVVDKMIRHVHNNNEMSAAEAKST